MAKLQKDTKAIDRALALKHTPWCEEYEAMISGMAYRSWESLELEKGRLRAAQLCAAYNNLTTLEAGVDRAGILSKRAEILTMLLGEVHGTPNIETPFSVQYGCNVSIGKNFFGNTSLAIDDSAFVTIGDNVIIGPEVRFITINHPIDIAERLRGVMYALPITVGDACWIGARVTIVPGANIRKGCTIGAGAVVAGNIPDHSVAVGSPARVVKTVGPAD